MPWYWKEPYAGARYGDNPPETLPAPARGLVLQELICVNVRSFTFKFYSADEIREYIAFFEKKTHPSSPGSLADLTWTISALERSRPAADASREANGTVIAKRFR